MMSIINVAKVLVVNGQGEALLLKRSSTDAYKPGRLDFPGGGIEDGESPALAARRELAEETGIKMNVQDLALIYASTVFEKPLSKSVNRFFYSCFVSSTEVQLSEEHSEYMWVPLEAVNETFSHHVYSVAVDHALKYELLSGLALHR